MDKSVEFLRLFPSASLCLALAACSDTADQAIETPVDPDSGRYDITLSGAGLLKHAQKDKAPKSFCLTESQREAFPHLLAQNYFNLHYGCTVRRAPREGNAIAGKITCPADPKLADGANSFTYNGEVAREKVKVSVRMNFDATVKDAAMSKEEAAQLRLAMKALEQARFVIEAKRIGDCG